MSNSKNKEEKREQVQEIVNTVIKNCLTGEGRAAFKKRIKCGIEYYMESKEHMSFREASIFLDTLLIFFELPIDNPYMFKGINGKTKILLTAFKNEDFVSDEDIVNRVFGFTDVLYYSGETKDCDLCSHAGLWMAYILLADPHLVVEANRVWYNYPPEDYIPKIDDGHLGMFG